MPDSKNEKFGLRYGTNGTLAEFSGRVSESSNSPEHVRFTTSGYRGIVAGLPQLSGTIVLYTETEMNIEQNRIAFDDAVENMAYFWGRFRRAHPQAPRKSNLPVIVSCFPRLHR